jgi:hypothetical protein
MAKLGMSFAPIIRSQMGSKNCVFGLLLMEKRQTGRQLAGRQVIRHTGRQAGRQTDTVLLYIGPFLL